MENGKFLYLKPGNLNECGLIFCGIKKAKQAPLTKPFQGCLAVIGSMTILGCLFSSTPEPDYPPLSKEKLIGCWFEKLPPPGVCEEVCYDPNGKYYMLFTSIDSLDPLDIYSSMVENYGVYRITDRNTVSDSFEARQISGNHQITSDFKQYYTIVGDTIFGIQAVILGESKNFRKSNSIYIRSDSANNCGQHWKLFSRPSDWGL